MAWVKNSWDKKGYQWRPVAVNSVAKADMTRTYIVPGYGEKNGKQNTVTIRAELLTSLELPDPVTQLKITTSSEGEDEPFFIYVFGGEVFTVVMEEE